MYNNLDISAANMLILQKSRLSVVDTRITIHGAAHDKVYNLYCFLAYVVRGTSQNSKTHE